MMDFIIGVVVVAVLAGLLFLLLHKKKKLSPQLCDSTIHKIKNTHTLDPAHALMESHKLFVAAIHSLFPGEKLTAAEGVSRVCKRFKNEHEVWQFHHLRNRLAHEPDAKVSYEQSHAARQAFIRALRKLI